MNQRTIRQSLTQGRGLRDLTEFGVINGHRLHGDPEKHVLIVDGVQAITCTPLEYRIAAQLLRSPNTPVSFAQFVDSLYLPDVDRRAVIRVISTLRLKIALLGIQITNVKTYGYMITLAGEEEKG